MDEKPVLRVATTSPIMNRLRSLLFVFALGIPAAHATDTDGDGMDDAWETSMGLSPSDAADALSDKDGDRVPNLWEYARGTLANNASSLPPFDAIVTMTPSTDPAKRPREFTKLQDAYDYLGSPLHVSDVAAGLPAANGRYLVRVKRGFYPASLDAQAVPKSVAWIGETGADRATGFEGAVLECGFVPNTAQTMTGDGLVFAADTVLDGFIIETQYQQPTAPAIRTYGSSSPVPRVRVCTTLIRYWQPDTTSVTPQIYHSGAILNSGADLWLVYCTIYASSAVNNSTLWTYASVEHQTVTAGRLHVQNSIVWNDVQGNGTSQEIIGNVTGTTSKLWSVTSVLQGPASTFYNNGTQVTGVKSMGLNYITVGGYLNSGATLATGGTASGAGLGLVAGGTDVHGQTRPATGISIGADQWTNTGDPVADYLPNWWELFWFGNLTQNNTGDPNGDSINNFTEYFYGTVPTADQDGDGLPDTWEYANFGNLLQNAHGILNNGTPENGNPDGDERDNLAEYLAGTNPLAVDADSDVDHDGLPDGWEIAHFGSITAEDGNNVHFGATNLEQQAMGTDPNLWTDFTTFDGNGNSLPDLLELRMAGTLFSNDVDGDGLSNAFELFIGSDPLNPDTNGDGIPDGLAWYIGIPVGVKGQVILPATLLDSDGDGISNADEISSGTNPYAADSDGDGIPDNLDPLPLDPTVRYVSELIIIQGTAPVITLLNPAGATPASTF
jgi:hypothetical protein